MKTIEIRVRLVAQVPDEIAQLVALFPDDIYTDFPLAQVHLMGDSGRLKAKFVEFETMNVEVLGD
jgi:hypothetical protein